MDAFGSVLAQLPEALRTAARRARWSRHYPGLRILNDWATCRQGRHRSTAFARCIRVFRREHVTDGVSIAFHHLLEMLFPWTSRHVPNMRWQTSPLFLCRYCKPRLIPALQIKVAFPWPASGKQSRIPSITSYASPFPSQHPPGGKPDSVGCAKTSPMLVLLHVCNRGRQNVARK